MYSKFTFVCMYYIHVIILQRKDQLFTKIVHTLYISINVNAKVYILCKYTYIRLGEGLEIQTVVVVHDD